MDRVTDLRTLERESIRAFVQGAADEGYLSGRVLDYGCGKQPYRDIVEAAGGEYVGYDRAWHPANVSGADLGPGFPLLEIGKFSAILCTQVLQYVENIEARPETGHVYTLDGPGSLIADFHHTLYNGGCLVLTYPTNWPEIESDDLWRFTKAGMERLLTDAGFEIVRHECRHKIVCGRVEPLAAGYGVIARA